MRNVAAVLIGLVVTGCAATWQRPAINNTVDPPTTAYVCVNLPESQRAGAFAAVRSWDRALGQWRHFKPVIDDGGLCTYHIRETTEPDPADAEALAWASMVGGRNISLMKGRYEHDVAGIVLHELGHCLGAQHVPGTLMNPRWSPEDFACPDAVTVAQVAAWNKVNLGLLSWCIR